MDSLEQERFDSMNDISNKEPSQISAECKCAHNHTQLDEFNLKEEINNNFLNEEEIILDKTCSLCGKRLIESNKGLTDKKRVSVLMLNKVFCVVMSF